MEKQISSKAPAIEFEGTKSSEELGHEKQRRDRPAILEPSAAESSSAAAESGRERLKRHRGEVAGRVWIPEMWGQETFLKDWIDSTVFDAAVRSGGIMSARVALMEERRRTAAAAAVAGFRIQNSC